MAGHLQYVAIVLTLCFLHVHGHRRLVLDGYDNLTALVAKLSKEVEQLRVDQSISIKNINLLEQKVQVLNNNLDRNKADLVVARATIEQFTNSHGSWSTYVRWGRSTCPGGSTEEVYSGYVGGSNWDQSGAAANYLCLVKDPYLIGNSSFNQAAQVFGAEYIIDNGNWEATSRKVFGTDVTFQDVPCVVCRVPRSTVVMVPGKNTCATGWTLEYGGLLSSGYYAHKSASEFVCLDGAPEIIQGRGSKQLGKLFYLTEAVCGSLKCPPYESGKELTCSVCSK